MCDEGKDQIFLRGGVLGAENFLPEKGAAGQISLRCTALQGLLAENNFFIIRFYAIMHRTIIQNKIVSIICSFFFRLIFIGLV